MGLHVYRHSTIAAAWLFAAVAAQADEDRARLEESSAPAAMSRLVPFLELHDMGGLAVGATCVRGQPSSEGGPTGGRIDLNGVPAGAPIVTALLY